jgi:hypothetical protein
MSRIYSGGCACGAIRYRAAHEPIFQNHCQCLDCQKRSGTGHGSYLTFAERHKVEVSGEAAVWNVVADSGNEKSHAFCPTCGTPVYLIFSAMPDLIAFHTASLDDPGMFGPQAVTYGQRGHAWDTVDATLPIFDRMVPEANTA